MVVLGEAIPELAHVGVGSLQTLVGPHDPHVVPHRVLERRPVLQDERRVFHVLVAWRLPVGDRLQERVIEAASAGLARGVGTAYGRSIGGPGRSRDERPFRNGGFLPPGRLPPGSPPWYVLREFVVRRMSPPACPPP